MPTAKVIERLEKAHRLEKVGEAKSPMFKLTGSTAGEKVTAWATPGEVEDTLIKHGVIAPVPSPGPKADNHVVLKQIGIALDNGRIKSHKGTSAPAASTPRNGNVRDQLKLMAYCIRGLAETYAELASQYGRPLEWTAVHASAASVYIQCSQRGIQLDKLDHELLGEIEALAEKNAEEADGEGLDNDLPF